MADASFWPSCEVPSPRCDASSGSSKWAVLISARRSLRSRGSFRGIPRYSSPVTSFRVRPLAAPKRWSALTSVEGSCIGPFTSGALLSNFQKLFCFRSDSRVASSTVNFASLCASHSDLNPKAKWFAIFIRRASLRSVERTDDEHCWSWSLATTTFRFNFFACDRISLNLEMNLKVERFRTHSKRAFRLPSRAPNTNCKRFFFGVYMIALFVFIIIFCFDFCDVVLHASRSLISW